MVNMLFEKFKLCKNRKCYCINFAQDLLNLWEEILTIEGDLEQWVAFEYFKKQFLRKYRSKNRADLQECNICSELLHRIRKFKDQGLALSTLLLELMTVIYSRYSGKVYLPSLMDDIQEIPFMRSGEAFRAVFALRQNTDFMKLLLHSGCLSSLPEENSIVRMYAYKSSAEFM